MEEGFILRFKDYEESNEKIYKFVIIYLIIIFFHDKIYFTLLQIKYNINLSEKNISIYINFI